MTNIDKIDTLIKKAQLNYDGIIGSLLFEAESLKKMTQSSQILHLLSNINSLIGDTRYWHGKLTGLKEAKAEIERR